MTDTDRFNMEKLGQFLNCKVQFMGRPYLVVDVLTDGPQLVLEEAENPVIQDNAYGRPYRRAPGIVLLPIYIKPGMINPDLDTLFFDN